LSWFATLQVKARDELLQQQQAAAAAEQQQQQVPDTSFYADGAAASGYQDHAALGYADPNLGLSYQVDPGQSQLYSADSGALVQQEVFYSEQPAYQCKL